MQDHPVTLTSPAKSCGTAPQLLPGVLGECVKKLPTFDFREFVDPWHKLAG
jgi:hypothetical protein